MKYALGTVVGTTLLALAKSKLGSGVKLKKGYKEVFEVKIDYVLNEHDFLPLQERQDILNQIKSTVESYGAVVTDIDFEEIEGIFDGEMFVDALMVVYINKSYLSKQRIEGGGFLNDFEVTLYEMENKINVILQENNIFTSDTNTDIMHDYISRHPYIKDQSGEWVPYTSSTPVSKLRKR